MTDYLNDADQLEGLLGFEPATSWEQALQDALRQHVDARKSAKELEDVYVIFDGPPGPEAGRFIETETEDGKGWGHQDVTWTTDSRGYWRLGPFFAPA